MPRLTDVVKNLLIINVLMFLAGYVLSTDMLALYYPGSDKFQPFQLVTHFFMHGSPMHLLFNMWALVMFGVVLETVWGPKKFLFFYLFCAFGAALLHIAVDFYSINQLQSLLSSFTDSPNYADFKHFLDKINMGMLTVDGRERTNEVMALLQEGDTRGADFAKNLMQQFIDAKMNVPVVGASGAIFGLLLGFGMLFPENELMLIFLPVPIKAKYFIPLLILVELFLGVNHFSWDNIAHFAHLGGALFGFLLILYWRKTGEQLY